jgi:hypothetical protein
VNLPLGKPELVQLQAIDALLPHSLFQSKIDLLKNQADYLRQLECNNQ